ncbi:uncharacterized protein TEOVI_000171500 [Trypanosoma equiperdum]|uniref:Uncharacterized protein n=4 Tax=Trypanozoon TaxID=39700 RepID=Q57Y74_TRYB2|nr:hypothetical protein, conserved [Trypanosoma brucei gambiense DAL972]XP_846275.1 hypothetical protein, conserved [Trypanosoma brucei brucei TREU927]AAX69445.1 hypothetical protein, conserved [Trypanosoma brucei]RHW71400.1 hypothetical protein DPX39_070076200 [Trypanosoma brucei equiperdum]SCU70142.1 hypothetical protein, conserved [Trypanosoma equiperdum]AAZ12716.1 hypothetical protein, conserved [Trypanosoma brucei brucei TREU927]CBH12880.1 hypothetical protein, conserved [Trypanosoma bru|eukprot:XP_011775159.1 hypothetical protein, conserved [Trypanosoma brucei gambiense DAL972]
MNLAKKIIVCLFIAILCNVGGSVALSTTRRLRYCLGLKVSYGRLNMRLVNVWHRFDRATERAEVVKKRCDAIVKSNEQKELVDAVNAQRKKLADQYYRAIKYIEPQLSNSERRVRQLFTEVVKFCGESPERPVLTTKAVFGLKDNFLDAHEYTVRAETLSRNAEREAEKAEKEKCTSEHFWEILDEDDEADAVGGGNATSPRP